MTDILQQIVDGAPMTAAVLVMISVLTALAKEWRDVSSGTMGRAAVIVVAVLLLVVMYFIGGWIE